ncbi:PIR Superfamily Protein [Plasmodium ovale wallikeri]|uniref:PIR Superfamily Protein n=1 Tax=Plasmodium ovale wallikeri TaxID=864142 RepID=A0A1A9ALB7_PLAOA|nr:PIR Superfamily Protein [Plasmodium ovale wallikeri]
MTEIREKDQTPHKFDNELNNTADESSLQNLSVYGVIQALDPGPAAISLLAKSLQNIELIRTKYSDSAPKRCRDVNYWFDKEIENRESEKEYRNISSCAITLFNDIQWKKVNNDIICKRVKSTYSTKLNDLRKKLDDFCEIRDNLRCTMLKGFDDCLQYTNYIEKKKKEFSLETNLCKENNCKIDKKCTLDNIDVTFPNINCHALYNMQKKVHNELVATKYSSLEIGFFLILSFFAIFLILLFISKMTPLGSLIRNYLIRINIIKKKMNEEEYDELLQYSFDSQPSDSVRREYYIDYTSLRN